MVDIRYHTIQQASQILDLDDETVLAFIHNGELVAHNLSKSRDSKRPTWRIAEADLGRFLISRRNQQAPQPKATKRPAVKQYV